MYAQGTSYMAYDRLCENSDKYKTEICDICGQFGMTKKDTGETYCKTCDRTDIPSVVVPYATKLIFQELAAMNMLPRVIPEKKGDIL